MKKRKSGKTFSGLQNGAVRGLQIGAAFRDYKSGHKGFLRGTALGISNQGKKITNRGRDFKLGKEISNRSRYYKLGQAGFQIGVGIINQDRD